jgi:hypothetical protein
MSRLNDWGGESDGGANAAANGAADGPVNGGLRSLCRYNGKLFVMENCVHFIRPATANDAGSA